MAASPAVAESPSSALPGGVEWLPALGGAHLLRAEFGRGDPPALVLQSASGTEHRIEPGPEARFSHSTDFLVPAGLRWSVAALQWPDGTRAVLPLPPDARAEVIPLPQRRSERPRAAKPVPLQPLPWAAPPWGDTPGAGARQAPARSGRGGGPRRGGAPPPARARPPPSGAPAGPRGSRPSPRPPRPCCAPARASAPPAKP